MVPFGIYHIYVAENKKSSSSEEHMKICDKPVIHRGLLMSIVWDRNRYTKSKSNTVESKSNTVDSKSNLNEE